MLVPSHGTTFVAGKQAVFAELVETASTARNSVDVDVFRAGDAFANDLAVAIPDDVHTGVLVTNSPQALAELEPFVQRTGGSLVPYGGVRSGRETFNHAKLVRADGERLTVSTAAMTMDGVERLDWGLTVGGAPAAAAARVSRALEAGDGPALRRALAEADAAGLHYNDPLVGARHATDAWEHAIGSARPGSDVWIATKKFTSAHAARALLGAADAGVGVHLVVARPSEKVLGLLGDRIDLRVTPWPGPSLHGNLTVSDDRLLLGTMYYSKRALGIGGSSSSREVLVGTSDAAAIGDARAAVEALRATAIRG